MANSSVPRIWRTTEEVSYSGEFTLEVDDFLQVRYARIVPVPKLPFICAFAVLGLFVGMIYAHEWYREEEVGRFALAMLVSLAAGLLAGWASYGFAAGFARGFWRGFAEKREQIGTKIEAEADARGLTWVSRGQNTSAPWDSFHAIEEDDRLFYFWISRYQAMIWPKRAFAEDEADAFRKSLGAWTGKPPVSPPQLAGNVTPEY